MKKRKDQNTVKSTYKHKNPLIRWYFNRKMNLILDLADLNKSDLVLDFGCGEGWLKTKIRETSPKLKVIGYDINPKQTEIKNYRKIHPDKVIAIDVFEHMTKREIEKTIKDFKRMNPKFTLITSIPTQNKLSRISRVLVGKKPNAEGHISGLNDILTLLRKNLKQTKKHGFFAISYLARFENKK